MMQRTISTQWLRRGERGFTLVEILVVMVIIGILGSLIAGNFVGTRLKARDSRRKNDLTQIQRSLEAYYNDHGAYPGSNVAGNMTIDTVPVAWGSDPLVDEHGTVYMATLPGDPSATTQYFYIADPTSQKYQLLTHFENANDDIIIDDLEENCGVSTTLLCNWGVTSSNTTLDEDL